VYHDTDRAASVAIYAQKSTTHPFKSHTCLQKRPAWTSTAKCCSVRCNACCSVVQCIIWTPTKKKQVLQCVLQCVLQWVGSLREYPPKNLHICPRALHFRKRALLTRKVRTRNGDMDYISAKETKIFDKETELFSKEPYTSVKEHYNSTEVPYVLGISIQEMEGCNKGNIPRKSPTYPQKTYISAKEPYVSAKEPYIYAIEPDALGISTHEMMKGHHKG